MIRHFCFLTLVIGSLGCASSRPVEAPNPILAPTCARTPIQVSDLEPLGFQSAPGKVVVVRLFRVSCPFCKEDLAHIGALFQNGTWTKARVQLFLIAYRKEGVENRKSFDRFMREELLSFGIPPEAAQVIYLDKNYDQLVKTKSASGELLLDGWRAVPFGLVFAKEGRLAYRGHFTTSSGAENKHYAFVTELQNETCGS